MRKIFISLILFLFFFFGCGDGSQTTHYISPEEIEPEPEPIWCNLTVYAEYVGEWDEGEEPWRRGGGGDALLCMIFQNEMLTKPFGGSGTSNPSPEFLYGGSIPLDCWVMIFVKKGFGDETSPNYEVWELEDGDIYHPDMPYHFIGEKNQNYELDFGTFDDSNLWQW